MSATIELKKIVDRVAGVPLIAAWRALDRCGSRDSAAAEPGAPERILMVKLWGIGNLAMILPLVRAVRRRHPRARLDFLTLSGNRTFLADVEEIDRLRLVDVDGWLEAARRLAAIVGELRRERYDLVLDFEQFLRASALLVRAIAPRRSVGFRTPGQARHGLYDVEVPHLGRRHMAEGFAEIVRAAGVELAEAPRSEVPRSARAAETVERLLAPLRADGRPLVVLHVGSGDNFPGRRWPVDRFAAVADHLARAAGARVLLTGTEAEAPLVAECLARTRAPGEDLAGRLDVRELIELLARVDLVVSNDTAPAHLADAVGTPLLAIFGPNTPVRYGPRGPSSRTFFAGLSCSPCITNRNGKTSLCRRRLCLETISPARVAAAGLAFLDARRPAAVPAACAEER